MRARAGRRDQAGHALIGSPAMTAVGADHNQVLGCGLGSVTSQAQPPWQLGRHHFRLGAPSKLWITTDDKQLSTLPQERRGETVTPFMANPWVDILSCVWARWVLHLPPASLTRPGSSEAARQKTHTLSPEWTLLPQDQPGHLLHPTPL